MNKKLRGGVEMNKKLIIVALIGIVVIAGGFFLVSMSQEAGVKVFHAGSLTKPFQSVEKEAENQYNFNIQPEGHGSVEAIKQLTELNKPADVIAVADYSLIPKMMVPDYTDWYIQFARNEMVIAYTGNSDYSDEIDDNNWYRILNKSGVRFGFSDPNLDPCGYRSPMVIKLAENYYDNSQIFDDLIEGNSNIESNLENGTNKIEVPSSGKIKPKTSKIEVTPKSVDLITKLNHGDLDYAFEYRSVAVQHDLKFIEFPREINLSSTKHENTYSNVKIHSGGKWHTGKPIVYGITVPEGAPNKKEAIELVSFIIGQKGQKIFRECGQPPITPAVPNDINKLPDELKNNFEKIVS